MTLIELIEKIKKECCLTEEEILKKACLSRPFLWRIKNGKSAGVRTGTLKKIVDVANKNKMNIKYSDIKIKIVDGRQK